MRQTSKLNTDIVIVGAGLVGLNLAVFLARHNFSVTLLEKFPLNHSQRTTSQGYDLRIYAINHTSEKFLQASGAWEYLEKSRCSAYENMLIWEQQTKQQIKFSSAEYHLPHLGYIIEHQNLMQASLHVLNQQNINIIAPCNIEKISIDDDYASIHFDQTYLNTQLIIGTDGINSIVRKLAKIPDQITQLHQTAIVANIEFTKSLLQTCYQVFSAQGTLALLPFAKPNHCGIVWSMPQKQAEKMSNLSEQDFINNLNDLIEFRFGNISSISKRIGFNLQKLFVQNYVQPRIVLLGDAAHVVHPMAGQGANLGLADAAVLSELLISLQQKARDYGLLPYLQRYQRLRKSPNSIMQGSINLLDKLFHSQMRPWAAHGMGIVNRFSTLKKIILNHAQGEI